jgi:hypothetical protein
MIGQLLEAPTGALALGAVVEAQISGVILGLFGRGSLGVWGRLPLHLDHGLIQAPVTHHLSIFKKLIK